MHNKSNVFGMEGVLNVHSISMHLEYGKEYVRCSQNLLKNKKRKMQIFTLEIVTDLSLPAAL